MHGMDAYVRRLRRRQSKGENGKMAKLEKNCSTEKTDWNGAMLALGGRVLYEASVLVTVWMSAYKKVRENGPRIK